MGHHIKVYFDADEVMHVCPKDSIGAMALKYWTEKFRTYGAKMIDVETEVPLMLGMDHDDPKPK